MSPFAPTGVSQLTGFLGGAFLSAVETTGAACFGSLVTLAWASWQGRRVADRRVRWFPLAALVAALASGAFGMMIVLFSLPLALGVLDVAYRLLDNEER